MLHYRLPYEIAHLEPRYPESSRNSKLARNTTVLLLTAPRYLRLTSVRYGKANQPKDARLTTATGASSTRISHAPLLKTKTGSLTTALHV